MLIQYAYGKGFLPEMDHVNVFIAAFTTSNARHRLYTTLEKLGDRVLYFDTDSVIYRYDTTKEEQYMPAIGDHLGQWTNELNVGEHITRFVSSGPKSYGYFTNLGSSIMKMKGFNRNYEVCQKLNFESLIELVLFWLNPIEHPLPSGREPYVELKFDKICRDKNKMIIFNREEIKKFRVTYDKRYVIPGKYDTLPYGY